MGGFIWEGVGLRLLRFARNDIPFEIEAER